MDIAKVSTEETHFDESVECPLFDAAGEPEVDSKGQPVVVLVVSEYSSVAKRQAQSAKQALGKLGRRYGSWDHIPQAELDALENQRIAAYITGWRGFESNGAPFPYSPENAALVVAGLRAKRPKQLAQIEGAVAAHASFFLTSSAE